jgi:hypothetical protein
LRYPLRKEYECSDSSRLLHAKDCVRWQTSDIFIDDLEQHDVEKPDLHEKRHGLVMKKASSDEYEWTLQDKHSDRSPQSNPG